MARRPRSVGRLAVGRGLEGVGEGVPHQAVVAGGSETACAGSRIAASGFASAAQAQVLRPSDAAKTQVAEISEPAPAAVGGRSFGSGSGTRAAHSA